MTGSTAWFSPPGCRRARSSVLRLYGKVLRQAGTAFSQAYMEDALGAHPEIARRLIRLFEIRFDPVEPADPSLAAIGEVQAIDHALDRVESLDEDRILRSYLGLVLKTVRTNYYQKLPSGGPKPYLAVKLASSGIDLLPPPRPLFEIYVAARASRACICAPARSRAAASAGPTARRISAPRSSG